MKQYKLQVISNFQILKSIVIHWQYGSMLPSGLLADESNFGCGDFNASSTTKTSFNWKSISIHKSLLYWYRPNWPFYHENKSNRSTHRHLFQNWIRFSYIMRSFLQLTYAQPPHLFWLLERHPLPIDHRFINPDGTFRQANSDTILFNLQQPNGISLIIS